MTPSIIRTQYLALNLNINEVKTAEDNYGVTIDFNNGIKFYGNQKEDFIRLIASAKEGLDLITKMKENK